MRVFEQLGRKKVVLGMIHLGVMPGTPFYAEDSYEATFEKALADARALYEGGADGCLVQTVDRVYVKGDDSDPRADPFLWYTNQKGGNAQIRTGLRSRRGDPLHAGEA